MSDPFEEISKMAQEGAFPDERDPDFTLPTGLPEGPWSACQKGECKCGFIWSADGNTHLASAHGPDALGQDWFGSDLAPSAEIQQAIARAIASIPDMVKEIERLAQENAELRVKLSDLADIAKTRAKKIRELNAFAMRR